MGGVAARQHWENAAGTEVVAMSLRVVAAVTLDAIRPSSWAAAAPPHWRNGVDERQELGDVVAVGRRQDGDQRDPVGFRQNVMLRPFLTAIGWVRSSFCPPRSARREALSTRVRVRSSSPRRRSSLSNATCRRAQTPARCQRTSRRQQVVPDPQPMSRGSMLHGMPLRRTKRMPVSTARSGIRGRPARWPRPRRGRGNSGSMRQSASSNRCGGDMRDRTKSVARVQALR